MTVAVRVVDSDDGLLEAARIDLSAFGLPFARSAAARAALDRSLPWRRATTTYIAELDGEPVGTARVYDMALSTPGAMSVPTSGIGDLGVLPSARGRGVLRALVARMLDDAETQGRPAAALYASEATIYGRFGFGPSTRGRRVNIPVHRSALRSDVDVAAGRTVLLEPAGWLEVLPRIFEGAALRRGGEVSRPPEIWTKVLCRSGDADGNPSGGVGETPGGDRRFAMVHFDPSGSPVAYALYSVTESWQPEGPAHSMAVDEVVALDAPAELAVWKALFAVGLVQQVETWVPVDSPLLGALVDRWAPSVTGEHDKLWVRLVDPLAALRERRYRCAGELVLELADDRREPSTSVITLQVAQPGDVGSVEATDAPPDLALGIAELAEVWLGGGSLESLAAIGRVGEAVPGAATRADALLGWSPLPYVTHDF